MSAPAEHKPLLSRQDAIEDAIMLCSEENPKHGGVVHVHKTSCRAVTVRIDCPCRPKKILVLPVAHV